MGSAFHDPCLVADLILGSVQDAGFVEPDDDGYTIRVEHEGKAVTSPRIDARLGRAVIARLAMIAELDLSNPRTASAVVPVRRGAIERDVVVTLRHGHAQRCDLSVLPRRDAARGPVQMLDLQPGDRAGHYVVMARLGEGGMGTVYRVRHAALDRVYALKVLSSKVMARDSDAGQRFLREARSAARIRHPNIVDVFDYGKLSDGRPYLVMELLEGESLEDLIDRGPVPVATVLEIARQLASALTAAHDRGIVHADITPANVLVASVEPFTVKVVDFGLAVAIDELPAETSEYVFGTVHYISPEQLRGFPATEQSDQYSLGVVLFELITGKVPFNHTTVRDLGLMHLHAPVPPVESPIEPLPARLAEIVTTSMQKNPSLRFPGMRALQDAVQEVATLANRRDWTRWLGR
jgi:serine/threonine protein kinase